MVFCRVRETAPNLHHTRIVLMTEPNSKTTVRMVGYTLPEITDHFRPDDRERLIELGVQFRFLKDSISELKQGVADGRSGIVRTVEELAVRVERHDSELSERVSRLENFRWMLLGLSAGVGAVTSTILHFLAK